MESDRGLTARPATNEIEKRGYMFEQVQSKRYYMQIVEQIRHLVQNGELKAGDKLPPERELSVHFGTSRASIREALSALETLGIIESKSGQGNYIKQDGTEASVNGGLMKELLMSHSPFEIYEARLGLEPILASMASARATPEEREKLILQLKVVNETGRAYRNDPSLVEDFMEEDRKLHLLIGKIAHNSVLFLVFSGVNLMMKEAHWRLLKRRGVTKPGNIEKYEAEHTGIVEAICGGREEEARTRMLEHLTELSEDLFQSE